MIHVAVRERFFVGNEARAVVMSGLDHSVPLSKLVARAAVGVGVRQDGMAPL